MSTLDTDLVVRTVGPEDQPAVLDLLRGALGQGPAGDITDDFYRWKHIDSPFGRSPGLLASHEGQVVGVRLLMRWRLEVLGQSVQAVRAVDTATHPAYQGRGIFRMLTLELLRRLEDAAEIDLVFNTPNASSRPGYLKMGWQSVGRVPIRLSPVRPLSVAAGARQALGTTADVSGGPARSHASRPVRECRFDRVVVLLTDRADEVATLLSESAHSPRFHTPLTLQYLTWRYGQAPGLDYRFVPLESAGRLTGFAIGRMRSRGPLSEFTVAELVVREGDFRGARRLLCRVRASGADHVTIHTTSGSEADRTALVAGYLPVPRYGLGLVTNARATLPLDPVDLRSWRLSLGDLEVF